jgi:hypothetical protein
MSRIQRAKKIFEGDLFPEKAINPGNSFNGSKFTDIIQILENLIELKELIRNYQRVHPSETDNIATKLRRVSSDLEKYFSMLELRFSLTKNIKLLESKERDDAYWEVLFENESKLQEYGFSAKFKLATDFEIGDKQGLDSELTDFGIFQKRLQNALSERNMAFSARW